ncbi:hypothetical protein FQN50_004343 [Emmonsiellopsis sp. PD_5]|nr:hypothetical protein FQN50_004343 [Emmonsiellopsis sp. PD_5]
MARLAQLPPELLLCIIQHADKPSLESLRTACRSLSTFATLELFKTVTLGVTERSHTGLESILEHPVLRSCVRKLWVDTVDWRPDLVSEPDHGSGPEMYERRSVIDYLPRRFVNLMLRLKEFVNLRHVILCFEYGSDLSPDLNLDPDSCDEMFRFFLSSVRTLGQLLLGLGLHNLQYINLDDEDTTMLNQVLGNLTSLRLHVHDVVEGPDIYDRFFTLCSQLPSVWLKPASSTLRHLALYSSLNLGFGPKLDLRGVRFPHLESLELGQFCFFCDSQLDWILSHRSTLRELSLDCCSIFCQVPVGGDYRAMAETRVPYGKRWHDYFRAFEGGLPHLRHFRYGISSVWDDFGGVPPEKEYTMEIELYRHRYGMLFWANGTYQYPHCRDEDERALEQLLRKTGSGNDQVWVV